MPCCACSTVSEVLRTGSSGGADGATAEKHFRKLDKPHQYAKENEAETEHIDAAVIVGLEERTIEVDMSIRLVVRAVRRREIVLDGIAFQFSKVALLHGKDAGHLHEIPFVHRYDGNNLVIVWDETTNVTVGDSLCVQTVYAVHQPVSGMVFGSSKVEGAPKFACSDHETTRARYWLLCQDEPQVRQSVRFDLSLKEKDLSNVQGYANGARKRDQEKEGHFVYETSFPTPSYLICVGIGQLREVVAPKGATEGLNVDIRYIAPYDVPEERLQRAFRVTPMAMRWLSNKVGQPFPFTEKYYQIIVPFIGGAMECVTFVTYDGVFDMDEIFARDWQHKCDLVILHEMTHSYFGDALVMKYFEHAWLKESWATYMMSCFLEDNGLPDSVEVNSNKAEDFKVDLYVNASRYFGECKNSYVRPIVTRGYDHSWNMFDGHLYPGGSWRLHMLRRLLGDDTFWTGVKNYVGKFTYGLVETIDFQRELEAVSNRNLHRFFDQWIYGAGHPIVDCKLSYDIATGKVEIKAEQVQKEKNQEPKAYDCDWLEVFDMDVPLEITVATENSNVYKTERAVLSFSSAEGCSATFSTTLPNGVRLVKVEIDPDFFVLMDWKWKETPGQDILKSILTTGRCFSNRIVAAKSLLEHHGIQGIKTVGVALPNDPNYHARGEIAKELVSNGHPLAVNAVIEAMQKETHNLGAVGISGALSDLKTPTRVSDIEKLIDTNDKASNYLTRIRLFESLGNCACYAPKPVKDAVVKRCVSEVQRDGHLGFYATAGAAGLQRVGGEEPVRQLLHFAQKGVLSEYGRRSAIEAIGKAANLAESRALRKEAAVFLSSAPLFDDVEEIRLSAMRAIAAVGESSFASAIEGAKGAVAEQRYSRDMMSLLKKLRKASHEDDAAERIGKMIEALEKKLKQDAAAKKD